MADEFQTGIRKGNMWNSSRNGFNMGSSPCSATLNGIGRFGCPTEMVDIKARSCEDAASVCDSSVVLQDRWKPQESDSVGVGSSVLLDSTLKMMGYSLPSTISWNQALLRSNERAECNFHSMLQEDFSSRENIRRGAEIESPLVQKEWSPKILSSGDEDSSTYVFKQINQAFDLDKQRLNSGNSSGDSTLTCEGLPTSFTADSDSYGYSSTLIHGLFQPSPRQQHSSSEKALRNNHSLGNHQINSNGFSNSWTKFPEFLKSTSPRGQPNNQLYFSNNTLYWKPSAAAMNEIGASPSPSQQTQFLAPISDEKPNCSNFLAKSTAVVRHSSSIVKKGSNEPSSKRPRTETPPLTTFKVRKEKLGDQITALQQLVSPFGKTDTASVLFEAIEYIKFLHGQVSVLSTPYMKNGDPKQFQRQNSDQSNDAEGHKEDLRSRGLCLIPVSSMFPVTNDSSADYLTPMFGANFR